MSTAGPGGPVLLTLLYDTLTWKDEHGIIPWLATSWSVSADGRDYTFTLAPQARWHDGHPVSADDVAFSFQYYARHPYPWTSTAMVQSASVLSPDHVRLHVAQPFAPFLEDIAGIVPIIPRHVWSKVTEPATYAAPDAAVGSGPFSLSAYRPADGAYRLVANPSYFRGPLGVSEYQQLNVPTTTSLEAVRQGQLELAWSTDASLADLVKGEPRLQVLATPPLSIVRLAVNTERAPLDRKETRQAILSAVDCAKLAQLITKGPPIPGSAGVVPPESPWFDPGLPAYPYDPARARALLGGARPTLELLADAANREPELLQAMLADVGITLVTKRVDARTRTQLLRDKQFQLGLVQHIGIGGDPDFLRRWYAGTEANDYAQGSVFHNPAFTQVAGEQAAELDAVKRKALVFRMQAILADQLPTIVLYYRRFYWLYDRTKYTPMNTWGGLIDGAPLVQNKLSFLRR